MRLKGLGEFNSHDFDWDQTFALKTKGEKEAFVIEGVFHKLLKEDACPRELCDGDGSTEWFYGRAWDQAVAMAESLGLVANLVKVPKWGHLIRDKLLEEENFLVESGLLSKLRLLIDRKRVALNLKIEELAGRAKMGTASYQRFKRGENIRLDSLGNLLITLDLSDALEAAVQLELDKPENQARKFRVKHK